LAVEKTMGYSSVRRVGEDIYSFLDFLSPRQGPDESTNPKPPPPQQEASATPGNIPLPGMSQPGSMSDADPGLPFQPPRPDSSKPVQVAQAAAPPPSSSTPAAVPPKGPLPPPPAAAAPALTSDKGTDPGAGAPTKPLGPAFAGGPAIPSFDPSTGKLDVMGILKQQQDAARRQAAMESFARGGTLMAAAATRSPSMRQVLAHAAGTGGGSSSSGDGGAGGISAATLLELDKRSRGEAAASYKAKIAPALAKHLGVPPEMIQYMDDDKIATLTTAIAKGENLDKEVRADGSVIWTNKTTGERFAGASPDQIKVQAAADTHAKTQAEIPEIQARTEKEKTETLEKQRTIVRDQNLEKSIPAIAERMGISADEVRQHYNAGTLDDRMKEHDQESPEYKQWREYRTQERLRGVADDKLTSYSDFFQTLAANKSPTGGPALETLKTIVNPRLVDMGKKVDARLEVLPTMVQRLDDLKNDRLAVGPIAGQPWFRTSARLAKAFFGDQIDISKVDQSDASEADLQSAVAATLKRYGVNPTDRDAVLAMKELGDPTLTKQGLEKITRLIIKRSVGEANKFNDTIDEQMKVAGVSDSPGYQSQMSVLKRGMDANYTEDMFDPDEIANFQERLKPTSRNPEVNAKRRAELMKDFDKQHGKGMARYLLTQNPTWLPE
jgi:hypothetical protein